MGSFLNIAVVVLLPLVEICFAKKKLELELIPNLIGDFKYRVSVKADDEEERVEGYGNKLAKINSDFVQLCFGTESVGAENYTFHVKIIDFKHPYGFSIWSNDYAKQLTAQETQRNKQSIRFGNYFKLVISPPLLDSSRMLYRLNVFCADSDQLEFEALTKSTVMVVFNSEQRKCEEYTVKVWPFHEEWLLTSQLTTAAAADGPAAGHVHERVGVSNGGTHHTHFSNHFHLSILPKLSAATKRVYWVEVKCHGREAPKYSAFTQRKAQVVLNAAQNCEQYDIVVSKLDKKWLQNVLMMTNMKNVSDLLKSVPPKEKTEQRQNAVRILNGDCYEFIFAGTAAGLLKRTAGNNLTETTKQQKLGQTSKSVGSRKEPNEQQSLSTLQSEMAQNSRENDEKIGEISTNVNALLSEISEIKKQDATKFVQILTYLKKEMLDMREQDEKKLEELSTKIGELHTKMEERGTKKAEGQIPAHSAENVQSKMGTTTIELEYEKKFERLSGQMEKLRGEVSLVRDEIGQSEARFVSTLMEIKKFMEDKFKDA